MYPDENQEEAVVKPGALVAKKRKHQPDTVTPLDEEKEEPETPTSSTGSADLISSPEKPSESLKNKKRKTKAGAVMNDEGSSAQKTDLKKKKKKGPKSNISQSRLEAYGLS